MRTQSQRLRGSGRKDDRTVADRDDTVERARLRGLDDRLERGIFLMKANRYRIVAPRIIELMTTICREHQLNAGASGRIAERAKLISGRRGQDQDSGHLANVRIVNH